MGLGVGGCMGSEVTWVRGHKGSELICGQRSSGIRGHMGSEEVTWGQRSYGANRSNNIMEGYRKMGSKG